MSDFRNVSQTLADFFFFSHSLAISLICKITCDILDKIFKSILNLTYYFSVGKQFNEIEWWEIQYTVDKIKCSQTRKFVTKAKANDHYTQQLWATQERDVLMEDFILFRNYPSPSEWVSGQCTDKMW